MSINNLILFQKDLWHNKDLCYKTLKLKVNLKIFGFDLSNDLIHLKIISQSFKIIKIN
jgi:hypothetical protein